MAQDMDKQEQRAEGTAAYEGEKASAVHRAFSPVWAAAGFVCFGLAMVGVALPFIPTTPFVLLAAFCFARSSERVNNWFKGTKVYKAVLEGYVTKKTMTVKAKLSILIPVTILLAIAFVLMHRVPVGQVVLAIVWLGHIIYFGFIVKTDKGEAPEQDAN